MQAPVQLIGTHTSTGASSTVHTLGGDGAQGGNHIADTRRVIQITGITGSTVKLQGSLDKSTWFDIGATISENTMMVLTDPVLHIRSNCTANTASDTILVYAQKLIEE